MKNLKNLLILAALSVFAANAQTALSSTTLGAAVSTTSVNRITLASTSGMLTAGPANRINTVLYVDKELMSVLSVDDSTHVTVLRAQGIGASARAATHASGSLVYYAVTNGTGNFVNPAGSYFSNGSIDSEVSGSCTATSEFVLPKVYLFSGNIWDCKNGSSGSKWILVSSGTNGAVANSVSAFCTGTVGSGATEYLNGAACSGATTATFRYTVNKYGTIANLRVSGSANVVSAGTDVITVVVNGTDTAITCTATAGTKICNDSSHAVQVSPGDYIQIKNASTASDTFANASATLGLY